MSSVRTLQCGSVLDDVDNVFIKFKIKKIRHVGLIIKSLSSINMNEL
jgi:hypothetical protein